jgi:hypothetical protein
VLINRPELPPAGASLKFVKGSATIDIRGSAPALSSESAAALERSSAATRVTATTN